jgi:hypothetical protein
MRAPRGDGAGLKSEGSGSSGRVEVGQLKHLFGPM